MKANDYVRTNSGWICKLGYYDDEKNRWITFNENDWHPLYESEVKISSPNIIDLIEVGDIIINQQREIIVPTGGNIDELKDTWKIFKNIKSIVTKEQIESMEYKVKE